MSSTVIAGIITGVVGIVVCLINNFFQNRKTAGLFEYRMDQLEKKVDLHNNAVERLYKAERAIAVNETKIKATNHRIDDLEDGK